MRSNDGERITFRTKKNVSHLLLRQINILFKKKQSIAQTKVFADNDDLEKYLEQLPSW